MPNYSQPVDLASLSPSGIAADLRATLARAERQLAPISPAAAAQPLAPGKWSTLQTIGHLIDSCANNHQRLLRLQLTPELDFPGYQQEECVRLQRFDLRTLAGNPRALPRPQSSLHPHHRTRRRALFHPHLAARRRAHHPRRDARRLHRPPRTPPPPTP